MDGEEEKEDDEEEKENDNETVKNGAKENGGKTEADPNKMKSGECKSVFLFHSMYNMLAKKIQFIILLVIIGLE